MKCPRKGFKLTGTGSQASPYQSIAECMLSEPVVDWT